MSRLPVAALLARAGALAALILAPPALRASRPPIVIVPGAPASELHDPSDGERIWPSVRRMIARWGADRIALPLENPESGRAATPDVIRAIHAAGVAIPADFYGPLETRLREVGYRRGDWSAPGDGAEFYLWPYDWRQSIESNGRGLYKALRELQARRGDGRPFVMVGHSMGGLLIRYALMYGDAPLGADGPLPPVSWAGAPLMREIRLAATPQEGSFAALQALDRGTAWFMGFGALPPRATFSFPGVFDLLPTRMPKLLNPDGSTRSDDLEDPATWERLRISVFAPGALRELTLPQARAHLRGELRRRGRLQAAFEQAPGLDSPVPVHVVGGECARVVRTAIVTGGDRAPRLRYTPTGRGAARRRVEALLFEPGDEMVARRSLLAEDYPPGAGGLRFATRVLGCHNHQRLPGLDAFTAPLLPALASLPAAPPPGAALR